jgi:predicted TPR repeat methyltransferase
MPSGRQESESAFDGTLPLDQAMELASGLHKAGLLEAADEIYRRILASAPHHVDALHLLGLARYQQGKREDALDLVRRAVALAPDHADALNNLGNMLLEQDRLEEAAETYERVLGFRPDHADAHSNAGMVFRRRGDLAQAEAHFRRAVEIDPNHGVAHHNLGSIVRDTGRPDEALGWFQRALVLRPYDGESYRRIGATLYALGRIEEAATIYARWTELEPGNPLARHMLAACSGRDVPARASDGFVRVTFDSFANSFDGVLAKLEYRAPALVAEAVGVALGEPGANLSVLDAGAGTGLCGPLLRPFARRLVGVDLSPGMLAKAQGRGVYDALDVGELTAYMHEQRATFDLVVSADTLVYFGDLTEVSSAAGATLRRGGHFVFTVEDMPDSAAADYRLSPHGRFCHRGSYVRKSLVSAGFLVVAMDTVHLRLENQLPVRGLLVTSRLA